MGCNKDIRNEEIGVFAGSAEAVSL